MSQERPIGHVQQQATVVFARAEILAVRNADDHDVYASIPHMCRALELDVESQVVAISQHGVLDAGVLNFDLVVGKRVLTTPCLRTSLIALWLAGVPSKRLRPGKRERIEYFQAQAGDVLNRFFGPSPDSEGSGSALVTVSPTSPEPAYAEGLAIARLAWEAAQLAEKRAEQALERADSADAVQDLLLERLELLEARLLPRELISEQQATYIADLVKQAALAISQKSGGGNFFGVVYGQLYRLFNVTSYKSLTQGQYPKAVAWLEKMIHDQQQP
jgi:hypothetical protein